MEHAGVLNVRAGADADLLDVAAQDAAVPDAGVRPELDVTDDDRTRRHPGARVQARPHALEGTHDWKSPIQFSYTLDGLSEIDSALITGNSTWTTYETDNSSPF